MKWKFQWPYVVMAVVSALFLIIEKEAFRTYFIGFVYGLALIVTGTIYTIRYKMYEPLLAMGWSGLALWHYFLAARPAEIVRMLNLVGINSADSFTVEWLSQYFLLPLALAHLLSLVIVNLWLMPRFMKSLSLEKNARKIFKLSAEMVYGMSNGYTDRPFYAGKDNFNEQEIIGFARFLSGKNIIQYRVTPQMVDLGFSMGRSPLTDKTFSRVSHISFANNGEIAVQVSKPDYRMYRHNLTFDQLCMALSNLFRQFFEYYKNGNEERILTELKSI
jgi:hypothetical protein